MAGLDSSIGSTANVAIACSPCLGCQSVASFLVSETERGLQSFSIALFAVCHCAVLVALNVFLFSPPQDSFVRLSGRL
jgi:hypothetical protein